MFLPDARRPRRRARSTVLVRSGPRPAPPAHARTPLTVAAGWRSTPHCSSLPSDQLPDQDQTAWASSARKRLSARAAPRQPSHNASAVSGATGSLSCPPRGILLEINGSGSHIVTRVRCRPSGRSPGPALGHSSRTGTGESNSTRSGLARTQMNPNGVGTRASIHSTPEAGSDSYGRVAWFSRGDAERVEDHRRSSRTSPSAGALPRRGLTSTHYFQRCRKYGSNRDGSSTWSDSSTRFATDTGRWTSAGRSRCWLSSRTKHLACVSDVIGNLNQVWFRGDLDVPPNDLALEVSRLIAGEATTFLINPSP